MQPGAGGSSKALVTGLVHTRHCAKGPPHNASFNPHRSAEAGISIPISQMRQMKLREVKQ